MNLFLNQRYIYAPIKTNLRNNFTPMIELFLDVEGYNAKKSYFIGVRIFCTAVYCHWAVM